MMDSKAVLDIIGDVFVASSKSNGNIKIDIKNLTTNRRTDDEVIDLLVEARTKLKEAGYKPTIRLSQRKSDGTYNAWAHIWVNETQLEKAVFDAEKELEVLRNKIAELEATKISAMKYNVLELNNDIINDTNVLF